MFFDEEESLRWSVGGTSRRIEPSERIELVENLLLQTKERFSNSLASKVIVVDIANVIGGETLTAEELTEVFSDFRNCFFVTVLKLQSMRFLAAHRRQLLRHFIDLVARVGSAESFMIVLGTVQCRVGRLASDCFGYQRQGSDRQCSIFEKNESGNFTQTTPYSLSVCEVDDVFIRLVACVVPTHIITYDRALSASSELDAQGDKHAAIGNLLTELMMQPIHNVDVVFKDRLSRFRFTSPIERTRVEFDNHLAAFERGEGTSPGLLYEDRVIEGVNFDEYLQIVYDEKDD
tara:strand:+ start:473 stop:1342 length:870 start_codon:yes stop_codon:yes gene_type:complete